MTVIKNETNKAMSKGMKKRNSYNPVVVDHLVAKYGYTKTYIRQSIDGTKKGVMCEEIKKEYHKQVAAIEALLK